MQPQDRAAEAFRAFSQGPASVETALGRAVAAAVPVLQVGMQGDDQGTMAGALGQGEGLGDPGLVGAVAGGVFEGGAGRGLAIGLLRAVVVGARDMDRGEEDAVALPT